MERRRKFPHAENPHPREEWREGHLALVERRRAQERLGREENVLSALKVKQEYLPHHHPTLLSPPTGRQPPKAREGPGKGRALRGSLQELHLWEWI